MKDIQTLHALNRFGLGPARGEDGVVGSDPRGWVLAQIADHPMPQALSGFRSAAEIAVDLQTARMTGPEELSMATRAATDGDFFPEIMARARHMIGTDRPFAERMVLFWSNHFTVSRAKSIIGPATPAFEREVIRPHVFGRFADMALAAIRHPVMIGYLDNHLSMGERSVIGQRRLQRRGGEKTVNENLAREVLELHTLGVDGGYGQDDVMSFARALTGWSHGGQRMGFENRPVQGGFEFKPAFHEPGPKTVLGRTYPDGGEVQARAILSDLTRHPATARHIATKLVRHFVADAPPADAVDRIAAVFRDTDGDLAEVTRAVVGLDAAWAVPLAKAKSHYDFVIGVHRAIGGGTLRRQDFVQPLREMGQMPFGAPSPAGWGDRAPDWIAPEALMRRIEWLRRLTARRRVPQPPLRMLDDIVGPVAGDALRLEVSRAATPQDALTMILASPEFQRR